MLRPPRRGRMNRRADGNARVCGRRGAADRALFALAGVIGLCVLSIWEPILWQGGGQIGRGFILVRYQLVCGQLSLEIAEINGRIGFDDLSARMRKGPRAVQGPSPLTVFVKIRDYYRGSVPWYVVHPEVQRSPDRIWYDKSVVWYTFCVSYLTMPVVLIVAPMFVPFAMRWAWGRCAFRRRRRRGLCTACGYDVRGSPSGVCPECGTRFAPAAGRQAESVGEAPGALIRDRPHASGSEADAQDGVDLRRE